MAAFKRQGITATYVVLGIVAFLLVLTFVAFYLFGGRGAKSHPPQSQLRVIETQPADLLCYKT